MKKNIRIGFTIIGECTFENSTILQSVTKILVFSIQYFQYVYQLNKSKSMVIIIIHEIEKYAFYNCNRIKKIPEFERVSKIGQYASLCCSLLQIN